MQVILLENIKKLGSIGQKVNVNDGYARNYLLKNNKALLANKKNLEIFEKQKEEINKKNQVEKNKAKEVSDLINNVEIEVKKEAMDNGQLYGSVTIKEIKNLIQSEKSLDVPADQIEIKGQIKTTGISKVYINLHAEVQAVISLNIQAISEQKS